MNNRLGTASLIAVLGFLSVCVGTVTVLILAGKDVTTVIAFMVTGLIPVVSQVALGRRIDNVGEVVSAAKQTADENNNKLDSVQHAVNGNLDAKIAGLVDELESRLKEPNS